MSHRPDCNCSQCGIRNHFRPRLGLIPRVSSGSRLLYGLGQDDYSDDGVDTSATDETPAPEELASVEEAPAPEELASNEDVPAPETEVEESPEEAEASGLDSSDIASMLAAGMTLTSSGIKTAAALGIIKKPASVVSAAAAHAATVSPSAAAAMAVSRGAVKKSAPGKFPMPLLLMGALGIALVVMRKR